MATASPAPIVDEVFFSEQFSKYFQYTVRTLSKQFRRGDAEDVAQAAWAIAWNKRCQFEGRSRFHVWVICIARRLCISEMRKVEPVGMEGVVDPSYTMNLHSSIELGQVLAMVRSESRDRLIGCLEGRLDSSDSNSIKLALHRDRRRVLSSFEDADRRRKVFKGRFPTQC